MRVIRVVCPGVTVTVRGKLHGVGRLVPLVTCRTWAEVPET